MSSTTYMIEYLGQMKEPVPTGLPRIVRQNVIVEVEGLAGLKAATEAHIIHIMRTNMGMMCRNNEDAMMDTQFEPDTHYFVPIGMIACLTTITKRIVGQVPDEAKKGNTVS